MLSRLMASVWGADAVACVMGFFSKVGAMMVAGACGLLSALGSSSLAASVAGLGTDMMATDPPRLAHSDPRMLQLTLFTGGGV